MDAQTLRQLLDDIAAGTVSPDDALLRLRRLPFTDMGFAKVDHHRALRQPHPEAVFGPGKTPSQCSEIVGELLAAGGRGPVLLTRASPDQVALATKEHPGGEVTGQDPMTLVAWRGVVPAQNVMEVDRQGKAGWGEERGAQPGKVVVVTAGTGDLPVAGECCGVLRSLGIDPILMADCGVAGVHRLLAGADELAEADAVVAVAGMEGALASVVGGITGAPVVAVPTSVGYGSSLEGVTALLAMTASCAAGVTVVGIDNGFGAATAVARIMWRS